MWSTLLGFFTSLTSWVMGGASDVVLWLTGMMFHFLSLLFHPGAWLSLVLGWMAGLVKLVCYFLPESVLALLSDFKSFFGYYGDVGKGVVGCALWVMNQFVIADVVFSAFKAMLAVAILSVVLRVLTYVTALVWTKSN